MIEFAQVELPEFGCSEEVPEIPVSLYIERLKQAVERIFESGLDVLLVYADREHAANLAFLTGFEPRFEEALFCFRRMGRKSCWLGTSAWGTCHRMIWESKLKCFRISV